MGAQKIKTISFFAVLTLLWVWVILEGLTSDPTFSRLTNFSSIAQLYEPIKNSADINILAVYPMKLNNGETGFPMNHQVLGQMIHHKTLVNGADPFTPGAVQIQASVADISNHETIARLIDLGIDTIIIHDRLLPAAKEIIERLRQDSRLSYVGNFIAPYDGNYLSMNNLARSIFVFQIRTELRKKTETSDIYTDAGRIDVRERSAAILYFDAIDITNGSGIYFAQAYSPQWKLYLQKQGFDFWGLAYLLETPVFDDTHQLLGEYGNFWTVELEKLRDTTEASTNFKMVLCFRQHLFRLLFRLVSIFVFCSCLVYLVLSFLITKYKNNN